MNATTETRTLTTECVGRTCKTRVTTEFVRGADLGGQVEWYASCPSCGGDLIVLTLRPAEQATPALPKLVEYCISVAATSTVERNVAGDTVVTMIFPDYGTANMAWRELGQAFLDATIASRGKLVKITLAA